MANLQKFLTVFALSIASLFSGMIISSLTKSASDSRTLDALYYALSFGFLAFVAGVVFSVILIIKIPTGRIKMVLYSSLSFLIITTLVIVLGNLNNWWK